MQSKRRPNSSLRGGRCLRITGTSVAAAGLVLTMAGGAGAATKSTRTASRGHHSAKGHHSLKASDLKVAIFIPGTKTDDAYDANGARAAKAIEKLGVKVTVATQVSTATQNQTFAEYAGEGYNMIIGWGGQFSTGAKAEAAQFPKTDFLEVNGEDHNGKNLGSFDIDQGQWQYVGGYLAGLISKSGVVGWIGGQCYTSTIGNELGSKAGVEAANPKAKFLGTFLGTWTTPNKAEQSANALISRGADIIMGNQNQGWSGIYKAAESHPGTKVIDEWQSDHKTAPSVIASTVVKTQVRYALKGLRSLLHGHFAAKHFQYSLKSIGKSPAISKTSIVSSKDYKAALKTQTKIQTAKVQVPSSGKCP